jgi:uncharacterized protein YhjY with autotransporter beta-barrel domain
MEIRNRERASAVHARRASRNAGQWPAEARAALLMRRRTLSALMATTVLTSAVAIVAAPTHALADDVGCTLVQGVAASACTAGFQGSPGKTADNPGFDGPGHAGGDGGAADALSLTVTDGAYSDVVLPEKSGLLYYSPVNVGVFGGAGAQGSDASTGGSTGNGAGYGGKGGDSGGASVTIGPAVIAASGSIASGVTIVSMGGEGGAAGYAQANHLQPPVTNNVGGYGGDITNTTLGGSFNAPLGNTGAYVLSQGGDGGRGRDWPTGSYTMNANGPDAANAGDGGAVNVTITGLYKAGGVGAWISSVGGTGGGGGAGWSSSGGQGGDGGQGGSAGNVSVTLASGASVTSGAGGSNVEVTLPGLWVQSLGGQGGGGGGGEAAGAGGAGASAGAVSVEVDGSVSSTVANSAGVLAQSIGGAGAGGGNSDGWLGGGGGAGAGGGAANTVTVTGSGGTINNNSLGGPTVNAPGILAQSIGGGGGAGGNAGHAFAVGGDGGAGGDGATVVVNVKDTINTSGDRSDGIAAQSIGGGGGNGGDATGTSVGLQMTIGGSGANAGVGGSAQASSAGVIATVGNHSSGMLIQSVGGGGGNGGAAYSKDKSGIFGASLAVGGTGGGGGDGGNVDVANGAAATNTGRILTSGSDSFGILGQSIGGGGGVGGAATAQTITYAPKGVDDLPNIAVAAALGGAGGAGGNAQSVNLVNAGLIATTGSGSAGIAAQSIGGGGGNGGDSSATAKASGGDYDLTANVSIGGTGGAAANGGLAKVDNQGLIVTTGETADGILAQSVGGGGGAGGSGDGQASASSAGTTIALTLNMGGSGAAAGKGGDVTATNEGAIVTLGDGAAGIVAQTVGGGGGRAGGAAGSGHGSANYGATVNLGGTGGGGGDTYTLADNTTLTLVKVTNTGSIVTFGADAPGIVAQSVAGGGGMGGKAATNLGTKKSTGDGGNGDATGTSTTLTQLSSAFAGGGSGPTSAYNSLNGLIGVANGLLANQPSLSGPLGDDAANLENLGGSSGESDDDSNSKSISLAVSIGGSGGAASSAGAISVTNTASIGTTGKMSDGIVAQAIGGGGGKGGAATASTSTDMSGTLAIGGTGKNGGNGGQPVVTNSGAITTIGALAAGIVVQSIAGGGGMGGASATTHKSSSDSDDGTLENLALSLGGNGGADGTSGQAVVTNSGAITTRSHDSIGIIAQSIAGGGGIIKTMATDLDNTGGAAKATGSDYDVNLKFGGSTGTSGSSGLVQVTNKAGGDITTSGDDSYGILAQSISGGGGLVLGGKPLGAPSSFFGSGKMEGSVINDGKNDGTGNSGVLVDNAANITTSGAGAVGVFAQSIGGGGGLAGDTGWTQAITGMGFAGSHDGSGGYIGITIEQNATVTTSGTNAPAILAQSIGGGGGRFTNKDGAYNGSAGGTGDGGPVNIVVNGTVSATGEASPAIYAQSVGWGGLGSPITITVGQGAKVSGGPLFNNSGDVTPALWVADGSGSSSHPNTVSNSGVLTSVSGVAGTAVLIDQGYTQITNNVGGTIIGNVDVINHGTGCITNNGSIQPGSKINVGGCSVTNNGSINAGGPGKVGATTITGDFIQGAAGVLVADVDPKTGQADLITVDGKATVGGQVKIQNGTLAKSAVAVLTATGGVTLQPALMAASGQSPLIRTTVKVVGNNLQAQTDADFKGAASGLGSAQQKVAAHLQEIWDSGSAMNGGFSSLQTIKDAASYGASLNSLTGQSLGAIAAVRYRSDQTFISNMFGGCADGWRDGICTWGRFADTLTHRGTDPDVLGYSVDAQTYQAGVQKEIATNLFLGGSVAYEASSLKGQGGVASVSGNSAMAGATLAYRMGPWEFSGAADLGRGWYDTTRNIRVGDFSAAATASPAFWNAGTAFRVGYSQSFGAWRIEPFVDLNASYVRSNAYSETGAGAFNLAIDKAGDWALSATGGVQIGGDVKLGSKGMMLHPFATAAVEYLGDSDWAGQARFVDQPGSAGFKASTPLPNVLGKFVVGADLFKTTRWNLRVEYGANVGADYLAQTGAARLSVVF